MYDRIYCNELFCYRNATEEELTFSKASPCGCFYLEKLKSKNLRNELREFIIARGKICSVTSIREDITGFNMFTQFVNDVMPDMESIKESDLDTIKEMVMKWAMSGRGLEAGKKGKRSNRYIMNTLGFFMGRLYDYYDTTKETFSFDADTWYLDTLPFEVKRNPVKNTVTVSFGRIKQKKLKDEVKQIEYIHLKEKKVASVYSEILAASRLSEFLSEKYAAVESLADIDRDIYEDYIIYLNVNCRRKKTCVNDLFGIRRILLTAGEELEMNSVKDLLCMGDRMVRPQAIYKVYTESEMARINNAVAGICDKQIARLIIIHQLLGTRISETLTLEKDCLYERSGTTWIRLMMHKTSKYLEKPVSDDVVQLIEASIRDTEERYGKRKYIFVKVNDPDKPMQYSYIYHQIKKMIKDNDLRDDRGNQFEVSTHIWRHCYGKRLTSMHLDDLVIARMMGHSGTGNLKNYRKISNEQMAVETSKVRNEMDVMLEGVISEWK